MSRRFLFLWCIIVSVAFAGTVLAQDRSALWNAAKRVKYGLDATTPARPIQPAGGVTMNPLSPPNTPDIQVFNPTVYWQSEISIGVNFANPTQLMVSSNGQIPGSNPVVEQPWAFSTDGGLTWPASLQSEQNPPNIVDDYGDPVAFFDVSGRAYYMTLGSPGGIYLVSTTNFGATWSARSNADNLASTNDDKEHGAADYSGTYPNNVYAAWTDFNIGSGTLFFNRSTDKGATWGTRQSLLIGSARGQGAHIAIGPNGEVYVIWADYAGSGTQEDGLGFAKSTDGGVTFSTPRVAYPYTGVRISNGGVAALNNAHVSSFPYGDVDRSNGPRRGWIYTIAPEYVNSQADIFIHRSTDGGTTWSGAIQVNGPDVSSGKWQWFPSIAVDPQTGGITVSYYSMDSSGTNYMTNRYAAYSNDGGTTWDNWVISDVRVGWGPQGTPNTNANYNGDYAETAAAGGKAWPIFWDHRSGTSGTSNKAYIERIVYANNFGWVRGIISSTSGSTPISGVAVDFTDNILQQGYTTGSDGFYLAGAQVDTPGTTRSVTLRARKFGYVDTTRTFTITRNDTVRNYNFSMRPAPGGTLSVYAHTSTTNVRAFVQVKFGTQVVISDSTNATTGLLTAPLPTGTYSVFVDPPAPLGARTFPSVVITNGGTTNVDALVAPVITYSPSAVRDTVPVNGTHTKTLTFTNTTTTDSIPYRISDASARISRPVILEPKVHIQPIQRPKGAPDIQKGASVLSHGGGPDAFGYQWVDSDTAGGPTFNWVDISTTGTQITTWSGTADDGSYTTNLPWPFSLYGNSYTAINIVTNGFANFGTASTAYSNDNIPTAAEPNRALYPFWDDLNVTGAGRVFYKNDSTNGRFIVQWDKVPRYGSTTDTLTFEIIIKPSGEILFQYLNMVSATLNSNTVGIENADGSVATNIVYNNTYVHNNLATRIYLPDAPWISENPTFGTIPPNSNLNVQVMFDATGLTPGTLYNGNIVFQGTHPKLPAKTNIPASLQVNAATNALMVLNKATIAFPGTVIGNVRRDTINARNAGGQVLNVTSITTTNTRFTLSQSSATINPGSNVNIVVTYTPVIPAGADTGRVIFLSNSSDATRKDVTLSGTAIGAPIFRARVDSLTKTVAARSVDSTRFYVRNIGTLVGNYAASAIMYPRTSATGPVQPIVVPMKVSVTEPKSAAHRPAPQDKAWGTAPYAPPTPEQLAELQKTPPAPSSILAQNAYGLNVYQATPPLVKFDPAVPGTLVTVGTGVVSFAGGFDVTGSFMYVINNTTATFGTLNISTAAFTSIGAIAPVTGDNWTACKVDPTTGIVYATSTSGTTSTLYRVNTSTGAATVVGTITNVPVQIAMAIDNSGQMYVYDIDNAGVANSRFFRVDKTTGAATLVGDMGFVGRYAQDMDFDRSTNTLYAAAYNYTTSTGQLRTINVSTGATTLLGSLGAGTGVEIDCFSIQGTASSTGPWLAVKPATGTIAINDSTQLTATFDARDISIVSNPGTYYGRIEVAATNSSLADTLRIPVRMTVTPISGAALYVNPDSAVFAAVPIGQTDSSQTFLAKNIGTTALSVTNIVSSNPAFTVSRTSFTLNTNDTVRVKVRFTAPTPAGLRTGTLTFTSNDPSAPTVRLKGTSIGQAGIVVVPDSFSFSLPQAADTTRANMKIKNPGTDTLRYSITETLRPNDDGGKSVERSKTQQAVPNVAKGAIDHSPAQRPDSSGGPDAFGYRWIDSDSPGGPTYSWTDITTVGTQVTTWTNGTADDGSVVVPLPFNFSFYGSSYSQLKICTNGWQGFDVVSTNTAYSNTAIPATAEPNNALYPFWDDMDLSTSGTVHYYSDAANSRFIVQYTNVPHYGTTEPGLYTFQTILYADGRIVYQYKDLQQTLNSCTIGIENSDGTVAMQTVYNATYVHNNLAILYTADLLPWLSLNKTSGTIAPGDSTTVQLRVVPNVAPGVYLGHELITGNTPSTARAAVRLQVTGGTPAITVTAPHGGETWRQGSTYAITWNQVGVDTVKLEYSTAGNAGPWTTITAGVPARAAQLIHPKAARMGWTGGPKDSPLGTYNWTIPNTVPNSANCFVKVSWKSTPATYGISAAAFTISNVTPADTSWTAQTLGTTTPTVYCIKAVSKDIVWLGTTGGSVYRTTNGGTTWTLVTGTAIGTNDVNDLDAIDANNAWVSTSPTAGGTNIIRTTDGGTTWTQVYTNTGGFIDGIRMSSSTTGYAIGDPTGGSWIFVKTTDGGATWAPSTAITQSGTEAGWNNSFQILGNAMWFGTNSSHIYKSTNSGATWTAVTTTGVNSYGVRFNSATVGMAGFESGIENKSTDAGSTWAAATTLTNAGQAAGVAGVSGNEFWSIGGTNVYWTSNQGTTWNATAKNGYTGTAALWAIDMVASGSDVYGWAGGASGTILRYRRLATDVTTNVTEIPTVYALDQNYPNPFNPTTTIRYSLPEQSTVTLKIYNLLGQEVATLVSGDKPASFYSVVWNGTNNHGTQVSSGLYFYRIEATGVSGKQFNSLKKLVFLK